MLPAVLWSAPPDHVAPSHCWHARRRSRPDRLLFVIGLGLLREFLVRVRPIDELRLAVLLCLFSCVFLYHRSYDSVILALPLFYCVDRA